MDGGRRLLRSLKETLPGQPFARPAFAGLQGDARQGSRGAALSSYSAFAPRPQPVGRRRSITFRPGMMELFLRARATTFALGILFMGGVGLYGTVRSGQYDAFVAVNGSPLDTAARTLGFGLDMAREMEAPMPFVGLAQQMFAIGQATGHDGYEATGIACNVYDEIHGNKK